MTRYAQYGRLAPSAAGFTIIELMVAMTLSLVLMAGALSILYSSKLTSSQNEHMARIQEAGRTAFELIMQDTRAAGYMGCAKPLVDNSTNPPSSSFTNGLNDASLMWNFGQSIYGFEATTTAAWTPALDVAIPASPTPAGGSDVLVVRTGLRGAPVFRTNALFAANADIPIDMDPTATIPDNTPMVISDCQGATVVMATHLTPAGNTGTIAHGASGGGTGNLSGNLPRVFATDAMIQPVQTVVYYIASCTAVGPNCATTTPPALWQIVSGSAAPQELIQGVEAMQVKYGVDTDGDLLANTYQTADQVADWGTVVSINLAVLVRSIDEYGSTQDTRVYHLLGGPGQGGRDFGPFNDRRQRTVFTTTITLRNDTT